MKDADGLIKMQFGDAGMSDGVNERMGLSKQDLEKWLETSLIPIEPDATFIRRLKARLIRYSGGKAFSIWMVIGSAAIGLLLILTWLSMVLRAVFLLLGLLGLLGDRRLKSQPAS